MEDPQPTVPVVPRSGWRSRFWGLLTALAACAALPLLMRLGARRFWLFELSTHFTVYYSAAYLIVTVAFLLGRKWITAGLCGLCLVWTLILVLPVYGSSTEVRSGGRKLRVLMANVLTSNREHAKLLDLIQNENPDLILAIETDYLWIDGLRELERDYPHHRAVPRNDNFGIALYSKLPLVSVEFPELGESFVPSLVARVGQGGEELTLIGVHTLPPRGERYSNVRNSQMAAAAVLARNAMGPVIAMGDFNITPWSPFFSDFVQSSGLSDSRRGFGIQPTWTARRNFLRIPIDHAFVSDEVGVVDRRVGPDIGSDHFPVILDLSIVR